MNQETRNCQNCKSQFVIEPGDFVFYGKIKVPPPTWCPECRLIRRLMWRNERALYKRPCDLCGEGRVLMYPERSPYKIYCYPCWWSDKWDAKEYARDYDFSKSFFEQFNELLLKVPRPGAIKQGRPVESEYTNRVTDMRHCYLVFNSIASEYCRYGAVVDFSKECLDCYNTVKSERCYESIDCFQCYNLAFSQECNNCTDSWFLKNCNNCQNCFGCVNLRNKSYCIFNKQYSKEEYQKIVSGYQLTSAIFVQGIWARFNDFKKKFIVPSLVSHHNTNVSGNWIENSKNVRESFVALNVEEGKHLFRVVDAKDVMDYSFWGATAELIYESVNSGRQLANLRFVNECWDQVRDVEYSMNSHSSHNLFGCVGLRNAEYCILNQQYSKETYEALVPKIRDHMTTMPYRDNKGRTYEYGEFYPMDISPFSYNETANQEFFPIDIRIAGERGYRWKNPDTKNYQITLDASAVPDSTKDVQDGIVDETIGCEHGAKCNDQCTLAFRITTEDLSVYRRASLPIPRLCPNCRHFERIKKRTPIRLWQRKCQCGGVYSQNKAYHNASLSHPSHPNDAPCPNEFKTSYAPDRPEIVYCESCYNAEVV